MIISNQAYEQDKGPMVLQLNSNPFRSEKSRAVLANHQVLSGGGTAYEYAPSAKSD